MNDVYDHCDAELARLDPERRLTTRFMAPDLRRRAVAVYAFNLEIARVREIVSEPTIGLIRLQWWRDAIAEARAGRPRAHPVVHALMPFLDRLPPSQVEALLTARERDLDDAPFEHMDALIDYARGTAGTTMELALAAIGVADGVSVEAGAKVGEAWGLLGALRLAPFEARLGRERLGAGLAPAAVAARARALIAAARRIRVNPRARAPLLLAELATLHFDRAPDGGFTTESASPGLAPVRLAWRFLCGRF